MQLLTDAVFETDNIIKLMDLFYKSLSSHKNNKFPFNDFIEYDEFRIIIHKFIIEVMGLFLNNTKYSNNIYDVYIKDLPKHIHGIFYGDDNKNDLVINDKTIKSMYDGDLEKFMSILHELNHFKVKYDILDGGINLDLCRIVKENLLRDEDRDPFNEIGSYKSLKGKRSYINDFYYEKNYRNYSEEVYVDICSKRDFMLFMRVLYIFFYRNNDSTMNAMDKLLDELIRDDLVRYNNHIRDLTTSLSFNSNYLSFYEAFDVSVKYHPEWLKYPQISVEYYLDSDGYVKKKDILQLRDDLSKIDDVDTREYVEYLIKNIENKDLSQGRGRG